MWSKSARSIQEAEGKTSYKSCFNVSGFQLALYFNDRFLENGIGRHFVASSKRRGKAHCLHQRRQTDKAEQSYAVTELEMLDLFWATKQFRCYLYGRKFVAKSDHVALTYLRNFADQNSRLLRWSIKLPYLDFVVEHRAGGKDGPRRCA